MALQTIVNANIEIAGAAPAAQPLDILIVGATLTGPQATAWTNEFGGTLVLELTADTWQDTFDDLGITDGEGIFEFFQLLAQNGFPRVVQVGRRATPVAQVTNFDLGDAGAATDGLYRITINGVNYDEVASADTRAAVVAALIITINAGSDPITAAPGGDAEQIDITSDEAGVPFSFAASAPAPDVWTVATTTPNEGLTTDIGLWETDRQTQGLGGFYVVTIVEAVSEGLARQSAEAAGSFARDIQFHLRADTATDPNALSGTGIATLLAPFSYDRLCLFRVPTATDFDWAAIEAKRLVTSPGSTTWGNVQLTGVDGELYTSSNDNTLIAGPYAFFDRIESLGPSIAISRNVRVIDGTPVDIIRGADFLKASVIADVFALLLAEDKVPYTRQGFLQIGGTIAATLDRFVKSGFISPTKEDGSPGYSVTIPAVPPPGDPDRIARIARGFAFEALLAGAVERVFPIDGLLIQ